MDYFTLGKIILATPWLVYLSVSDIRRRSLPNRWVYGGMLVMLAAALGVSWQYAFASVTVGFLCALFLFLPYLVRAAGAGDVKMLFAAGMIAGPGNVLNLILLISIAGLCLALAMLGMRQVDTARLKHYWHCLVDFHYDRAAGRQALPPIESEACRVPFGIAIAAGLFLNLLIQLIFTWGGAQ